MKIKRRSRKPNIQQAPRFDRNLYIKPEEMLVVTEDGESLGVLSKTQALQEARVRESDLVLISPTANPPVAKIITWSKFKYELSKKKKGKKTKGLEVKEFRFRASTEVYHLQFKVDDFKELMKKGHKVKLTVLGKGRAAKEKMQDTLNAVADMFSDAGEKEGEIRAEGRNLTLFIKPKK